MDSEAAQEAALEVLWGGLGFQNLSVDTLAYIYENTLVSGSTRRQLGVHSTPSSIARYIVNRLPFEDYPQEERIVIEPCSGHCVLLIAVMRRLRRLLPLNTPPQRRHEYLVKMLRGFEIDPFAFEVGKLCLTLADLPNPNGWEGIENRDVFTSRSFNEAIGDARFVVCNPPFEDFSTDERKSYTKLSSTRKPVELLTRVLNHLHPDGMLAFVLPRHFIDGKGYEDVRKRLAQRFRDVEVVALPDKLFQHSAIETALLVARSPQSHGAATAVSFAEVRDKDRDQFLASHAVTRHDVRQKTVDEAIETLAVPPLWDLWKALASHRTLGDVAEVHRGLEWKKVDRTNPEKCYSPERKPGYRPGFARVRNQLRAFEALPVEYLNFDEKNTLYGINNPWDQPKAIINAVRITRDEWRLAAFTDTASRTFSQQFTGCWPKKRDIPASGLTAILNSPLANAYMASHSQKKHNQNRTLEAIPIPSFSRDGWNKLTDLVRTYETLTVPGSARRTTDEERRAALLRIDAFVLDGYDLPPRLERRLLAFFDGEPRPVSCDFRGYNTEEFAIFRALGSDGTVAKLTASRERRDVLAGKLMDESLSREEDSSLAELDRILDRYSDLVAPLPFDELEHLEAQARLNHINLDSAD